MPRFRPTAKFERSAIADLWKYTLSNIPTVCGRIVYLATLRDANSGTYRHHGLTTAFGRDESVRALRQSHQDAFQDWLKLPLSEQSQDLQRYLAGLEEPFEEVVTHLLKSGNYRNYVPPTAMPVEAELYCRDLETLLGMLKNEAIRRQPHSVGDAPGRDSSQLA